MSATEMLKQKLGDAVTPSEFRDNRRALVPSDKLFAALEALKQAGFDTWFERPIRPARLIRTLAKACDGVDGTARADTGLPAKTVPEGPAGNGAPRLSILLAEDHPINQRLAITLLEKAGHRVEVAENGLLAVEAVQRAAALALYHLREAARVVGTASVPAKVRHAEALLAWCRDTGRRLVYSSDALRTGPNCIRTNDAFTAAMDALEVAGWAEHVVGGADLDGRHRARVWSIRIEEAA